MNVRMQYLRDLLSAAAPEADDDPVGQPADALDRILDVCRSESSERAPARAGNIYRICHAIARQYDLYPQMRQMMKARWGAESMRQMDLAELQSLFYFMRSLEKIKKG